MLRYPNFILLLCYQPPQWEEKWEKSTELPICHGYAMGYATFTCHSIGVTLPLRVNPHDDDGYLGHSVSHWGDKETQVSNPEDSRIIRKSWIAWKEKNNSRVNNNYNKIFRLPAANLSTIGYCICSVLLVRFIFLLFLSFVSNYDN